MKMVILVVNKILSTGDLGSFSKLNRKNKHNFKSQRIASNLSTQQDLELLLQGLAQ